jgi:hypothetical protein
MEQLKPPYTVSGEEHDIVTVENSLADPQRVKLLYDAAIWSQEERQKDPEQQ